MMKYADAKVVFSEIPDEITLAINISGCTVRCKDCHSKYLWEDVGEILNEESLHILINQFTGITCISFMGGDHDIEYLQSLFEYVKTEFPKLKVAWYSGVNRILTKINTKYLSYIKIGSYNAVRGPLTSPGTNQRMYKVHKTKEGSTLLLDITRRFWKYKVSEYF